MTKSRAAQALDIRIYLLCLLADLADAVARWADRKINNYFKERP